MFSKPKESTWFLYSLVFLIGYCSFLFIFRNILLSIESEDQTILKPEVNQIIAIGLFMLLYYFAFLGLYSFSFTGKWQNISAIVLSLIIVGSILYGFKKWYDLIADNPFLSFTQSANLPWYANEKNKFLIANSPLILFLISIFIIRLLLMLSIKQTSKPSTH